MPLGDLLADPAASDRSWRVILAGGQRFDPKGKAVVETTRIVWWLLKIASISATLILTWYAVVLAAEVARLAHKGILPAYIKSDTLVAVTAYVVMLSAATFVLHTRSGAKVFFFSLLTCSLLLAAFVIALAFGALALSPSAY